MFLRKEASRQDWVISDVSSNRFFSIGTYGVLCLVAAVMTVLNFITNKGFLTICTGVFAVLCVVNIVLSLIGNFAETIAKTLYAIEVFCMFTFFLVSGNPEGFSAIWICMLPSLGMFFFNKIKGTILCGAMFFVMAFFLWTPIGNSFLQYNYTDTFKMRFPILFVAFHMLAYLLETLRMNAYNNMLRMQEYYCDLSIRDQLTGLLNRQGMYQALEIDTKYSIADKITVAMFDIDNFKSINDLYGHNAGDLVLKEFSEIISTRLSNIICRWGGEEFVVIFPDNEIELSKFEEVRNLISQKSYSLENKQFSITVSIGIAVDSDLSVGAIDGLINHADEALYKAKTTGKNKIVFYGN